MDPMGRPGVREITIATLCTEATTLLTYCRAIAATSSRRGFSYVNWKAIVRTDRKLYAVEAVSLMEHAEAPEPVSSVDAKSRVREGAEESYSGYTSQVTKVVWVSRIPLVSNLAHPRGNI